MRISFDLDGVIADGHHWFFRIMEGIKKVDDKLTELVELEYYASRPLKFHPNLFLASEDEGFIITARKPKAKKITKSWLKRYGITLPVIFVDQAGEIDWNEYQLASVKVAQLKAKAIQELGVDVHFDNNPTIIRKLREEFPGVKAILIGGEEEFIS